MKNLAICVRGSIRTWDVCKHSIFKTYRFDTLVQQPEIDWFFDTWDQDSFTYYEIDANGKTVVAERVTKTIDPKELEEQIRQDFKNAGMNLVSFNTHKFDPSLNPAESFLKLVNLSNQSKRLVELSRNFKYDVVLQIRPDVITTFHGNPQGLNNLHQSIMQSADHFILNYTSDISERVMCFSSIKLNDRYNTLVSDIPGVPDTIFYGKSQIIDLISGAYTHLSRKGEAFVFPHASLFLFMQKYGVIMNNFTPNWLIVRNMKIEGKYDYQKYVETPDLINDETSDFVDSVAQCATIWYDLFDSHKII